MNKYQKALNRLKNITKVPSMFINEIVKELVDTFQELVDRATLKKINTSVIEADSNSRAWAKVLNIDGFCPNCDYQVSKKDNYCRMCGQALEREVENE